MKSVVLVKNFLLPFGLTAAISATDAAIQKKICGPGKQLKFMEYGRYRSLQQTEDILIPFNALTNFEVQKYYQNEPKFNGA